MALIVNGTRYTSPEDYQQVQQVQSNTQNWLSRTFDPSKYQAEVNSAMAIQDRAFQAEESQKAREHSSLESALNRKFNLEEAQKQRDFEMYMSNSAYTRAVQDMKKAGLNPYLVYNQGGASTPTGSSASMTGGGSSPSAYGSKSSVNTPGIGGAVISLIGSALTIGTILATKGKVPVKNKIGF